MKITVKLFSVLRKYIPIGSNGFSFEMIVPPGTMVIEVIEKLDIPADIIRIILINGRAIHTPHETMHDNDVVALFPPMAGG